MESKLKKLLKDICEEQSLKTKHIKERHDIKSLLKSSGVHCGGIAEALFKLGNMYITQINK